MSSAKLCICQLCTCPQRLHRCVYEPGEEHLRQASIEHCRSCGGSAKRGAKPYIPLGPMETSTTYSSEFQAKLLAQQEFVRPRKANQPYNRPMAPMADSTTYNADFSAKKQSTVSAVAARPNSGYKRPMGDMLLETTYNGAFQPKTVTDNRTLAHKPHTYQRPMGPMNMDTTYASDFTEKRQEGGGGYIACCPCCNPKGHGFVPQGEENGHTMFVRKG